MGTARPFVERLAPDTIQRLRRAAVLRFETADCLRRERRRLEALYFYGYSAEISLGAASFHASGYGVNLPIDRDTRRRRMAQARQISSPEGVPLMNGDPHPLVGWARFLQYQRESDKGLTEQHRELLRQVVERTEFIYSYWRPELRYKLTDISGQELVSIRAAVLWIVNHQEAL
jgi:hypothetical protein